MFSENAVKQIEELLNKAKEQKYRALILVRFLCQSCQYQLQRP